MGGLSLLEENTGMNLHSLSLVSGFLDVTPKAQGLQNRGVNVWKT